MREDNLKKPIMTFFTKFLILPLMFVSLIEFSLSPCAFAAGRKGNIYVNGEKVGYVVDEAAATFEVSMPEKVDLDLRSADDARNVTRLYGSYLEAAQHATYNVLPSFEQIGFIGKVTDDRIYAAIETELEGDKVELISSLAKKLDGDALSFICTALVLSHRGGKTLIQQRLTTRNYSKIPYFEPLWQRHIK